MLKDDRELLDVALLTGAGEEPRLVIFVNEDNTTNSVFVVTDGMRLDKLHNLSDGMLHLLSVYYISSLNYPDSYSSLLGLLQLECLQEEYAEKFRTTAFKQLRNLL